MGEVIENYNKFLTYINAIKNITKLNHSQVLYLMILNSQMPGFNMTLQTEDFLELVEKQFIFQNKITKFGSTILEYDESKIKNISFVDSTLPKLTEPTANIVKRLSTHFLGDMFKGSDYTIYNEHCKNPIMAPFFFMFMNMFPSSNADKNKHWNKHFDTLWTNVNLRRVTTMTVKKFKQVWKTKDIGLFLLGTYLFIQGSHNQEKNVYFVKSLENYWKEYDFWYETAQEMLLKGELENFTKPQKPKHQSNQFII
jgi:hypothetical protein